MAVDPKSLTVDYRQLMKMTARNRNQMIQSSFGQSIMEALTPTQLAMMFPNYYKKGGADLGKTGATEESGTTASPSRFMSGGGSGVSSGPAVKSSYAKPEASAQKKSWLDKIEAAKQERQMKIAMSSGKVNPLGARRTQAASGLSQSDKIHLYALTMAEVGRKNPKAQRALMETIYNRYEAQGYKSIRDVTTKAYYEPLREHTRGYQNYLKAKADLENNPNLLSEMESRHNEVLFGSNDSNYATHNSSANVAANARRTQTVTSDDLGETFSRKDRMEFAEGENGHGIGIVKAEKSWFEKRRAEMDEWYKQNTPNPTAITPGDPSQTGAIQPKQDESTIGPAQKAEPVLSVLPEGIDPNIKAYYDKLTSDNKKNFLKRIDGLPVETINKIAQENSAEIIAEVAQGKRLPTDRAVDFAMQVRGLHEVRDRDAIKDFLKHGKGSVVDPNDRWCANFVNASLEQAGIKGSQSPAAGSFQSWGEAVDDPTQVKRGDVLVNRIRSTTTNMIGSHVVMATGPAYQDEKGNWKVPTIGGNQSMQGSYERGSHYVSETTVDFSKWNTRRARVQDFYDPSQLIEEDPSTTGQIQPDSAISPVPQFPTEADPFMGVNFPDGMPRPNLNKLSPAYKKWASLQDRATLEKQIAEGWEKAGALKMFAGEDTVADAMNKKFNERASAMSDEEKQKTMADLEAKRAQEIKSATEQAAPKKEESPHDALAGAMDVMAMSNADKRIAELYNDDSNATKSTLEQMKARMPGIDFNKTTIKELSDHLKANPLQKPQEAPAEPKQEAPAPTAEAPKEAAPEAPAKDVPKMATGGEVEAKAEAISMFSNESGEKIGEVNKNENINFKSNGRVEVTPDHRLNPIELENQKAAQLNAPEPEPTPVAQPSIVVQANNPTNWAQHEAFGSVPTPNSYVRAMEQTRGRSNSGVFAGSRFGEDHNSNLS